MWEVCERIEISLAHSLPLVPEDHKCRRLHGHNYIIEACVRGTVLRPNGFVADFQELRDALWHVCGKIDHRNLNDTLENPTVENLGAFIFPQLGARIAGLVWLRIHETETSHVTYYGR